MKKLIPNIKEYKILLIIILLLWLKSYTFMRVMFDLPLENMFEEFILFLSPLASVIMLFWVTSLVKKTLTRRSIIITSFIFTFILYANIVYYRFFNDFITIPVLFQFKNFGDLGGSAKGLMQPSDFLLFIDVIVIYLLFYKEKVKSIQFTKGIKSQLFVLASILLVVNVLMAETQRPQLLTRTFDREMLVKYLGVYNYHVYDVLTYSKTSAQRAFAESSDIVEVENYVRKNKTTNEMTGIAKDKNVILISMESLQNFIIDFKVEGQEVTPFLNQLVKESFYFNNFFHQTGQGKTSDAEFLIDNSLYPLSRGAVFTTNSDNEYYALPELLRNNGYTTASLHGNNKSFWNRDIMYKALGYDHYFSEKYYNVTEENSINYGLKDKEFFEQSIPMLKNLPQPFHAKFLTLTNHYPYLLEEKDETISALTTGDGSVDRYVQTVRYLDEALKSFFDQLKEAGLYENSIIVLYGDHYGISANHNKAMTKVLGKEITPYDHIMLQKVPFIIHIPGMEGKTMDTVSGQIDVKPTILNLLGIEPKKDIHFGEDLFNPERRELVIARNGNYITDKYVYTEESCYRTMDGLKIETKFCEPLVEDVERELNLSDQVIQKDLLRFLEEPEDLIEE